MNSLPDYEKLGVFYLGRKFDLSTKKVLNDLVLFPSKNLVTHGLIVGMTGSGKTGLCFDIIEEAAIDSIPSIVIDPKGDLSNLLLTFPDLKPEDFKPWVNEEDATKAGLSIDQYSAQQAETWKKGLADWQQDADRIRRLRDAAEFAIYTPGSAAGLPVSVLKSFDRPTDEIMEDGELLRERVGTTVAGLLQLVGINADPVKSRETVFLANILQSAWAAGKNLDLAGLIQEVQNPTVTKIGVLDVESFFPAKQRFELAMQINNLLASPNFAAWMEGDGLDVGKLLYSANGKPRVAIFSIAHLGDAERMFFVTILLNQVLAWMRAQTGTSSLRALLYMDEIFGYFPPTANPPSKIPLLTLLKQARAFGLGVVLATQNPVDLDYKGLANIGTWFVGRLQTDRDKARILDGLEGAASNQGGRFDRGKMETTLAALGNRVFLLHSVHADEQQLFQSRWALSYMRGPMSRAQIKSIMCGKQSSAPAKLASAAPAINATTSRPVLPPDVPQLFAEPRQMGGQIVYCPRLIGAAQVRFTDKKLKIDEPQDIIAIVEVTADAVPAKWDQAEDLELTLDDLSNESPQEASFGECAAAAGKPKNYSKWAKEFAAWIYGNKRLKLYASPKLEETSMPHEDERAFRIRMQQMARELRDAETEKLRARYGARIAIQQDRVRRAEAKVQREAEQAKSSKIGMFATITSAVASMFSTRKRISPTNIGKIGTSVRSATRSMEHSGDVQRAEADLEAEKQKFADLEAQLQSEIDALAAQYDPGQEELQEYEIKPTKTNISVRLTGLVWLPFSKDEKGGLTKVY